MSSFPWFLFTFFRPLKAAGILGMLRHNVTSTKCIAMPRFQPTHVTSRRVLTQLGHPFLQHDKLYLTLRNSPSSGLEVHGALEKGKELLIDTFSDELGH